MAVGSYDANGIWNFGESDNIAPFSTTLNKLASSTSSAITADRARLATLEAGSLAGLIPVKPTAITVATGTAAMTSLGAVTFTGATAISLDGVFTPTYKNYRVVVTAQRSSGTAGVCYLRFRTGSPAADSTVNYAGGYSAFYYGTGGSTAFGSSDTSSLVIFPTYYDKNATSVDIFQPQEATGTKATALSLGSAAANGTYSIGGGEHNSSIQFTGLTIGWNTGTVTGQAQIFGYND